MNSHLMKRWKGPGGGAEVLRIALPLILSTSAHTIQMFVDRMFLMWHSNDAMSAALPAGIMAFTFASFFLGTVSYVNTFVAQYTGAGRDHRVGPAVWQGIFLALGAAVVMLFIIPAGGPIFTWIGHEPAVRNNEISYFKILCLGTSPMLINAAISGFFTGRGKTWMVLYVNVAGTLVNILLDYCLIFGNFGFPRWGIAGAATGTVIASTVSAILFICLFFRRRHRREFATVSGAKFDRELFGRLLRYGLPNGTQFMLDVLAFTLFIAFVGRISKVALTATNMAFQVNTLAFMPMIGFGIAVSTLVGQALGKNAPQLAQRTTWSAFYMTFIYMFLIALGYWFWPELFLFPFASGADPAEFKAVAPLAKTLLCFVAIYCLFDTGNIIFAAALKGAGDTRFVMLVSISLSWPMLVLPCYLAVKFQWGPHNGLFVAWGFASGYICVLAVAFLLRFLWGKWKSMRVIEAVPVVVPPVVPEVPAVDIETA